MSKCTAAQAVSASAYWVGYKEKASVSYSQSRDKSCFTANAGSNNYSYPGYLCGCNGQAWCAATVSTFIYEACGSSKTDAKNVLHGVWPYINVTQVYDAAPAAYKGRAKSWSGTWTPKAGDIVIFDWEHNNSRDHTGLCVAVTSTTITVREGNSGQMVKDNTYPLSSSYLWGYVRPLYADAVTGGTVAGGNTETVGSAVTVSVNELKNGCSGAQVKTIQRILYAYGYGTTVDGDFGDDTETDVKKLQAKLKVTADGVVGRNTWTAILTKLG